MTTQCRRVREAACDELVLTRTNVRASDYATHLVEVVADCVLVRVPLTSAIAGSCNLEKRVRHILSGRWRTPISRTVNGLLLGSAVLLILTGSFLRLGGAEEPQRVDGSEAAEQAPSDIAAVPAKTPDDDTPTRSEHVINVQGQIVDEEGKPFARADVIVRAIPHAFGSFLANESYNEILTRTVSDEQGRFSVSQVAIPAVFLRNDPGDNRRLFQVVAMTPEHGMGWYTLEHRDATGITNTMPKRAAVTGTIVDADGEPVEGATVRLSAIGNAIAPFDVFASTPEHVNFMLCRWAPETTTSADGRFQIDGMPEGSFVTALVTHPERAWSTFVAAIGDGAEPGRYGRGVHEVEVLANPVTVSLEKGYGVDLQLVDSAGNPVSFSGTIQGRTFFMPLSGAEDGRLRVAFDAPGEYACYARREEGQLSVSHRFTILEEHAEKPLTVTVQLPDVRRLTGRVLTQTTSVPLANVGVRWHNESDDASIYWSTTNTDPAGRFTMEVLPGAGQLSFVGTSDDAFLLSSRTVASEDRPEDFYRVVNIPARGDVPPVTLEAGRGLILRGILRDESGNVIAGASVTATFHSLTNMRYPQRQASTTDEQGRFEIVGNHPHGSFDVVAMNDIVVGRAIVEADRTRSLTEESVVELELGARRGVVIRGKVLEDGEPVPEVVMTLRRQTQNDGDRTTYTEIATTRTDADGTYRLPGLLKGDHYMVDASPPFLASDPEWRHGMPYSQEVPEIRTGELVLPDMHLIRYEQTLAGRVVDPNGKPVPGATVHAEFAHGMPLGRLQEGEPPWTETDDQGRFRLTNLPNRTLRLMAYIRPKNGGSIQFPAQVSTTQNQQDVRIVLDASLVQDEE